jgi:hypothetical protein
MSLGTTVVAAIVGLLGLIALCRLLGVEIHRREPEKERVPGKRLKLVRDMTAEECPWLDNDIPAGTIVFEYRGPTYGLKEHEDLIFVSFEGGTPFFQLPLNSLVEADHTK